MKKVLLLSSLLAMLATVSQTTVAQEKIMDEKQNKFSPLDIATIERVTGKKGKENHGEYKITIPQNDLNVEVLGTTFDVKNRHGQINVILETGKVKVAFNSQKQTDIIMLPGEMIAYEASINQLKRSVTDPIVQCSWVDKKIILNNAPVKEIIQYLEDNYGYKVILKDTTIGNKKMEGTLLLDNFQDILFVLSTSLDIKIEKKDSTLIFSKMHSAH